LKEFTKLRNLREGSYFDDKRPSDDFFGFQNRKKRTSTAVLQDHDGNWFNTSPKEEHNIRTTTLTKEISLSEERR
jgi:hypothetical protein